jgi:hypothetical protein
MKGLLEEKNGLIIAKYSYYGPLAKVTMLFLFLREGRMKEKVGN